MPQHAQEAAPLSSCPTCGALPCDQVNTPGEPDYVPSGGFFVVVFGLVLLAASPVLTACVLGWISMWRDILGLHPQGFFN